MVAAGCRAGRYEVAPAAASAERLLAADEAAWAAASPIEWGPSPYPTRFRALWSDAGLYLRFDATDPSPWHTMTRRDEHLWDEEVVEIFLDPDRSGRDYYELEINPANVVCDLRMISPWPDKKGDIDWNLAGLETRVRRAGRRFEAARLDGDGVPAVERAPSPALRGQGRAASEAGRRLALQRLPHQAAGRQGEPGEGRRVRGVVASVREELPRRRGLPRPRVRGPGPIARPG